MARPTICWNNPLICLSNFLRKFESVTWSGVWPCAIHIKSILCLVTYSNRRLPSRSMIRLFEFRKIARIYQLIQNPDECVFGNRFVQRPPKQENLVPVHGRLGKISHHHRCFLPESRRQQLQNGPAFARGLAI